MEKYKVSWKRVYIKLPFLLIGVLVYVLYAISFNAPSIVEGIYSTKIFWVLAQFLSTVTGVIPFSVGEIALYAFSLFIIIYIICLAKAVVKAHLDKIRTLVNRLLILVLVFVTIYSAFIFMWGLNYARVPISKTMGLDTRPSSNQELYDLSRNLIDRAKTLRSDLNEDENGVFKLEFSKDEVMKKVPVIYNDVANITGYSEFYGYYGRVKPVLYSKGLSWSGISGVYFPFTAEANVNIDVPDLLFAASSLHEAAHQRGFAREDEANFIAYYISSKSDDKYFEYSGVMLALIHSMNALYGADKDMFRELRKEYSPGMDRDFAAYNDYWTAFEGPLEETVETVNNNYLKANKQTDGVQSYGRMVDLLLALNRS